MNTVIRPATPTECAELAGIDRTSNPSPWSAAQFAAALKSPCDTVLAAEHRRQIAGFIVWQTLFETSELHLIAVSPRHRRAGIASQLMAAWLQTGTAAGANRFFLEVRAGNLPAQQLYRKYGFTETARRRGYYPSPQGREDALIMEKTC